MRFLLALALTASLGAGTAFGQAAGADDAWDARLTAVSGDVTVFAADAGAEGAPAEKDMPLAFGDKIRVGESGSAEIAIEGDSIVVLKANTEMTLTAARKSGCELNLLMGSFLAKIQKAIGAGGFRVRTPTAVCAVRGTEFGIEIAGESAASETHVGVFDEGLVEVGGATPGQVETLTSNQETVVRQGQRPMAPYVLKRLMAHRKLVRGFAKRGQALKKRWASLTPEKRLELRQKLMKRAGERLKKLREKALRHQRKKAGGPGGPRPDQEKLEKRRQKIQRGQRP